MLSLIVYTQARAARTRLRRWGPWTAPSASCAWPSAGACLATSTSATAAGARYVHLLLLFCPVNLGTLRRTLCRVDYTYCHGCCTCVLVLLSCLCGSFLRAILWVLSLLSSSSNATTTPSHMLRASNIDRVTPALCATHRCTARASAPSTRTARSPARAASTPASSPWTATR
jgi:hypothetical protein